MAYEHRYFKRLENNLEEKPKKVQFPAGKTIYDPQIAWWLAQCSQLAYENKITIATELQNAKFNKVNFFDASGTQAFLAQHPGVNGESKFAILAFRGTENDSIDILTDINFVKRLFPNENLVEEVLQEPKIKQKDKTEKSPKNEKFYAHGGFLEGLQNVWGSQLREEIRTILPNAEWHGTSGISEAICDLDSDVPLYFTGHSLGGALATLAAYKALAYDSSIKMTALYTFGSPRTAQRPLANTINKELAGRLYRIVNSIDVVPRLPPRIPIFLDFHHIDTLVYFTRNRKRKHLSLTDDFSSAVGVLALTLLEIGFNFLSFKQYIPQTIKKHTITDYIEDIEQELRDISL